MPQFGLSQQSSELPRPLSESEKRLVLLQLYELEAARASIVSYDDWIKREQDLVTREKSVQQQALDNEKRQTELAQNERNLAQDQAKFYKDLYSSAIKNRGCGICGKILRIFSLGAYRCK